MSETTRHTDAGAAPIYVPPEEYNEHPEYFEMLAGWHRTLPAFRKRLDNILNVLAPYMDGAQKILDYGCAAGATAIEIANRWPRVQVLAMDYSDTALYYARENAKFFECGPNLRFAQGDEQTLAELPEGEYDAVLLADIIEHVQDGVVLMERARQRLREAGVIVLETPNIESGFPGVLSDLNQYLLAHGMAPERLLTVVPEDIDWAEKYHVNMYNRDKMEREVEAAGLRVRERHHPHWWLKPNALHELFARVVGQDTKLREKWFRHLGTDFLYVMDRPESPRPLPPAAPEAETPAAIQESVQILMDLNAQVARRDSQQAAMIREVSRYSFLETDLAAPLREAGWILLHPSHGAIHYDPGQWHDLGEAEAHRVKSFGDPEAVLTIEAEFSEAMLVFYRHAWSGFVQVQFDDDPPQIFDLYGSPGEHPAHRVVRVGDGTPGQHRVRIHGVQRKTAKSGGTECLLEAVALKEANVHGDSFQVWHERVLARGLLAASGVRSVNSGMPAVTATPERGWLEKPCGVPGARLFMTGIPGTELSWLAPGQSVVRLLYQPGGGPIQIRRNGRLLYERDLQAEIPVFETMTIGDVKDGANRYSFVALTGDDAPGGREVWVEVHPTLALGAPEA